jgi:glycosyltransferase involved in cell wall biosynthesis
MKIAIDVSADWDYRGGIWRYGLSLAAALVKITQPGSVVLPCYDSLPQDIVTELARTGAEVAATGVQTWHDRLGNLAVARTRKRLPLKKLIARILQTTPLPRVLLRHGLRGADVLHTVLVPRTRLRGVAQVATIHDIIPLLLPGYSPDYVDHFRGMIDAFRNSGCLVIAASEATRRDLTEFGGFESQRIRVVHDGVDHEQFCPEGPRTDEVLARYGLSRSGYFLYVGSFDVRKNLERLVDAYLQARANGTVTLPLILVGQSGKSDLAARIRDGLAPGARHLGFVPEADLADLYRGARATILVSSYEGFGLPPIESMACGTPAIVANRSCLPEVVGDAGLIVDPEDTLAIAQALGDIETDARLHSDLRAKGLVRASRFTWEATARATLSVYHEACGARSQHPTPA